MSETVLDRIKAYKLEEIAADKEARPQVEVEQAAAQASPVRGFANALHEASRRGFGLIAEVKKASPSKGLIRQDFDPAAIAAAYEAGGAACLSVLTDEPSFQGDKSFLVEARNACKLPVLRKDFMYDPYQVFEARALGADCILLIMASLSDAQAKELEDVAHQLGMDVLVEIHNEEELERAGMLDSRMIGINNRNLHTFETTLDTTRRLSRLVPENRIIVAESGMNTPEDLADLARFGARCFLIGESMMRQDDVEAATRNMLRLAPGAAGGML